MWDGEQTVRMTLLTNDGFREGFWRGFHREAEVKPKVESGSARADESEANRARRRDRFDSGERRGGELVEVNRFPRAKSER